MGSQNPVLGLVCASPRVSPIVTQRRLAGESEATSHGAYAKNVDVWYLFVHRNVTWSDAEMCSGGESQAEVVERGGSWTSSALFPLPGEVETGEPGSKYRCCRSVICQTVLGFHKCLVPAYLTCW